jgi:hypothetical protein
MSINWRVTPGLDADRWTTFDVAGFLGVRGGNDQLVPPARSEYLRTQGRLRVKDPNELPAIVIVRVLAYRRRRACVAPDVRETSRCRVRRLTQRFARVNRTVRDSPVS